MLIYLQGSFEAIMKRVNKRGREYELDEGLLSYYRTLWQGYDEWVHSHYNASEVLVINIDKLDYVGSEEDKATVIKMVENKLKQIRE